MPKFYKILCFALATIMVAECISASLSQAQRLQHRRDMEFGEVEFTTNHDGKIRLTPNGNLSLTNGPSGLVLSGTGQSGRIRVRERNGVIEIRCSDTALLADSVGNTLEIDQVRISYPGAKGWGNADTHVCNGVSGAPTSAYDLTADPSNVLNIYVGGKINANNNGIPSADTYSTTNAGGTPVTIDVIFQ